MTRKVTDFTDIQAEFNAYIREIKYATMITVDARNRPRGRILFPVWEVVDGRPRGWLAVYKTPVKAAHLARNPHTTYSYWSPRQNAVFVDSVSTWADDDTSRRYAWDLYIKGSPPGVGYDPARYWRGGPDDPGFHVLRIEPWRIQLIRGTDLRGTIWQPGDDPVAASVGGGAGAEVSS